MIKEKKSLCIYNPETKGSEKILIDWFEEFDEIWYEKKLLNWDLLICTKNKGKKSLYIYNPEAKGSEKVIIDWYGEFDEILCEENPSDWTLLITEWKEGKNSLNVYNIETKSSEEVDWYTKLLRMNIFVTGFNNNLLLTGSNPWEDSSIQVFDPTNNTSNFILFEWNTRFSSIDKTIIFSDSLCLFDVSIWSRDINFVYNFNTQESINLSDNQEFNLLLPGFLASPDTKFLRTKQTIPQWTSDSFSLSALLYSQQSSDREDSNTMKNAIRRILVWVLSSQNTHQEKISQYRNTSQQSSEWKINLSLFQNAIRTTTGGQWDIWLREWTQNSLDAQKNKTDHIDRDFFVDENQHFVAQLTDHAGMSPDVVFDKLLTIGDSSKRWEKKTDWQIGMFGVWFFSAFTETCKQVRVKTTKDWTTTTLIMTPKHNNATKSPLWRDDIDIVTDIETDSWMPDGTVMQRIDTAQGLNANIEAIVASDKLKTYTNAIQWTEIACTMGEKKETLTNAKNMYTDKEYTFYAWHKPWRTQHWLYIWWSHDLIHTYPKWMQDIITREKIVVDIPPHYQLNRARNAINDSADRQKIQSQTFSHLSRYCIEEVFAGNQTIPAIPKDFFSFDFHYLKAFDSNPSIQKAKNLAEKINNGETITHSEINRLSENDNHLMYYLCYIKVFGDKSKEGISLLDIQKNKNDTSFLEKRKDKLQWKFADWLTYDTKRSEQTAKDQNDTYSIVENLWESLWQSEEKINILQKAINENMTILNKAYNSNVTSEFYQPTDKKHSTLARYYWDKTKVQRNINKFKKNWYFADVFSYEDPSLFEKFLNTLTHEYGHHLENVSDSSAVTHNTWSWDTFETKQREVLQVLYQVRRGV